MKISAINQAQRQSFSSVNSGFLEKFHENTKNSADMTDTILVPRTIFKGYLGIMSGTTLVTLGALLGKFKLLSKTLSITGLLASLYGTYAFVRPYIIKDAKGVATSKDK
jgi:hypothetical protein